MVSLTETDAVAAVRKALDELQPNESYMAGVVDSDNVDLDTIIKSKMVEAVAMVHSLAPRSRIADAPAIVSPVVTATGKVLKVEVPQNMLRFLSIKATDSPYLVTELIEDGSADAIRQTDQYACGTYERPEAVLHRGNTLNQIWYYSLATELGESEQASARLERISYLTYPAISSNAVQVCDLLKDAVISMLTGLVLTIFKDKAADEFFSQARLQMGITG